MSAHFPAAMLPESRAAPKNSAALLVAARFDRCQAGFDQQLELVVQSKSRKNIRCGRIGSGKNFDTGLLHPRHDAKRLRKQFRVKF